MEKIELNKITDISDAAWYQLVNDVNTRIVGFLNANFDLSEEEVKDISQNLTEIITGPTIDRLSME